MAFTINGTSGLTFPNSTLQSTAAFTGAATNAVSSSAITLSSSSPQYQVAQISSYTNSYVTMPDATTVGLGSNPYVIENRSPYGAKLELRNNAGTTIGYIPIGQIATVQLKNASTAAGQWAVELTVPQTFFAYDVNSITSTTTSPTPAPNTSTSSNGIVGLTSTTFVRWWTVTAPASNVFFYLYTQVGVISGSSISYGSIQSTAVASGFSGTGGNAASNARVVRLSNTAFVALCGQYASYAACCASGVTAQQRILACTVSGTVVTFGTPAGASMPATGVLTAAFNNQATSTYGNGTICRLSDTSFALFYNDTVSNTYGYPYNYSGSMSCQIVTVSGVTLTIGAKVTIPTSTYSQVLSAVALSSTAVFLCYGQAAAAGGSTGRTKIVVASVSGTTPTFGTPVSCESSDVSCFNTYFGLGWGVDGAVAPSATQVVFNSGYATGEATVSGTTPTFDSFPYTTVYGGLWPLYLATSSKAYGGGYASGGIRAYLSIATGGFVANTPVTDILQTNLSVQSASPVSPLGAQPTTAFIAYSNNANGTASTSTVLIGNTT